MVAKTCTHTDQILNVTPNATGCEECLKTGRGATLTRWASPLALTITNSQVGT